MARLHMPFTCRVLVEGNQFVVFKPMSTEYLELLLKFLWTSPCLHFQPSLNASNWLLMHYFLLIYTGLFEIIVGVLTTCHTQYTWDRSICIFFYLIEQHSQVFVTYLIAAPYVHPLWFYKHQHDNRVNFKLFVACQRWWFQWRFWFVLSVPG